MPSLVFGRVTDGLPKRPQRHTVHEYRDVKGMPSPPSLCPGPWVPNHTGLAAEQWAGSGYTVFPRTHIT